VINQVILFGLLITLAQFCVADSDMLTRDLTVSKHQTQPSLNSPSLSFSEEDSAEVLLERMVLASKQLNYHGTVVYSHDGIIESMQVIHKGGPGGEVERLVQLNGVPREVIRKDDVVTCYMSGRRSVLVGKRNLNSNLLATFSKKFASFSDTYRFDVGGIGRVAGKVARIINIQPKDNYRYGYKLWLNKENALLLKSELVGANGDVLEQVMFVQLDVLDSIPDFMLQPSISGESYTWHQGASKTKESAVTLDNWLFSNLPVGFKISTVSKQQMPNSKSLADHVIISDGLASISVYIESFGVQSQPFVGSSYMGAVNIYGAVVDDFQVTVVGEVPPLTVKMIAESVLSVASKAGG